MQLDSQHCAMCNRNNIVRSQIRKADIRTQHGLWAAGRVERRQS